MLEAETVIAELESLGKTRLKKMYMNNGAKEPVFGCATGAMKPLSKQVKINHRLAEELYATGNYDVMYFAGIIADPQAMTVEDFDRWMDQAYFYMLADNVVSVTLSESDIAQEVADKWIASGDELRMSAGYSCYCWLLGSRKDQEFDLEKIAKMLDDVAGKIHGTAPRAKAAMNNFVYTVGVSFKPLHERALKVAAEIGVVTVKRERKKDQELAAYDSIMKEVEKDRIGFKRRYVRC